MHLVDPHTLELAYLLLHLVGMAVLLGGALMVALVPVGAGPASDDPAGSLLGGAARYERLFWVIVALQVLTGIGNAGMLGSAMPGPATAWGGLFTVKLALVLAVLVASLVRLGVVARIIGTPGARMTERGCRLLRSLYLGTALFFGAVVLLAVRLVHG